MISYRISVNADHILSLGVLDNHVHQVKSGNDIVLDHKCRISKVYMGYQHQFSHEKRNTTHHILLVSLDPMYEEFQEFWSASIGGN